MGCFNHSYAKQVCTFLFHEKILLLKREAKYTFDNATKSTLQNSTPDKIENRDNDSLVIRNEMGTPLDRRVQDV